MTDFATHLSKLDRADLEALLSRRPETQRLRTGSAGWATLAGALSTTEEIHAAIRQLDRFHRQVLDLACLCGGRLRPDFAEREGLDPAFLPTTGRELARWGLAFPEGEGLWAPDCVVRSVPDPAGMGRRARALLEEARLDDVRRVAANLQARAASYSRADLLDAVAARLTDIAFVRELLADAPDDARTVLDVLRAEGGAIGWSELAQEVPGALIERGTWHEGGRNKKERPVSWLRARGLVIASEWDYRLNVPAEVELALRERIFTTWAPAPPALELSPLAPDRHPADVVTEIEALADLWRRQPATLNQNGDLGVRELKRAAAAVGVPESLMRFDVALAGAAGLVQTETDPPPRRRSARGKPPPPPTARLAPRAEGMEEWRAGSTPERWTALARAWLASPPETLTITLPILLEVPEGQAATLDSLAQRLAWRWPAYLRNSSEGKHVFAAIGATLHALGMAANGPAIGLTPLGRAAFGGASLEEVSQQFPPLESSCTVTADLRVIVPGPPTPELARALARVADLEASAPARVYRLSDRSLRRAFDEGVSTSEILDYLGERSANSLPQNVVALIEDVGRRHGRLRIGEAALYLQADDPGLLAEVVASRRLKAFQVRTLAPTVAVVVGATQAKLLEALRASGHMPATDEGEPAAPLAFEPAPARRRAGPARKPGRARPAPKADRAIADLADRIQRGPGRTVEGYGDAWIADAREIPKLIRWAIEENRVLEVQYPLPQYGGLASFTIEPQLVSGDTLVAWSEQSDRERFFVVSSIRRARATDKPRRDQARTGSML